MSLDIKQLIAEREASATSCMRAISMNRWSMCSRRSVSTSAISVVSGNICTTSSGERYLDLLSGWGVFAIGRNHPTVREALTAVLDSELPNLVQMGVSALSGVLAERLLAIRASSRQGILFQFRHRSR